jgi:streptomycin 6-kinase
LEAAALGAWRTAHTPSVIASDDRLGALLLEAIDPGTPLDEAPTLPDPESVAELVRSLHESADPHGPYPRVEARVTSLFDASASLYQRHPQLLATIPPDLYERARRLAGSLARDPMLGTVLLHGDLTPRNILDGGAQRGLVAIDPAPCLGDAAFDAVDLLLWNADDLDTIERRARGLAAATGMDAARLLAWCQAFAAMNALELASRGDAPGTRIDALRELASKA